MKFFVYAITLPLILLLALVSVFVFIESNSKPYFVRTEKHARVEHFIDSLYGPILDFKSSDSNYRAFEIHYKGKDTLTESDLISIHKFVSNQKLRKENWDMISVYSANGNLLFTHSYDKKTGKYYKGHFVPYD